MYHSILLGKGVLHLSKLLNRTGSTWPGHAALKADKRLIKKVIQRNPDIKIVLVAGTNGKTTTTKALSYILRAHKIDVLTNQAGANLLNGLASLLVKHINLEGKLKHKALIFEVDENSLPRVLKEIPNPNGIILLNLFRDQLDRYGEVNTTAESWKECFKKLTHQTAVIANADDPLVAFTALTSPKSKFFSIKNSLKKKSELSHAVDSITCPKCNEELAFASIAFSHLGNFKCKACGFENPKSESYEIKTKLLGEYNQYNLNAALLTASEVFGVSKNESLEALQTLDPAFGRQEIVEINGKRVMFLLSKNPTGFNESLAVATKNKNSSILILLNDRIPDGRDISWIWDVDFEDLSTKKVYVSGDRAYDMANRLAFASVSCEVFEDYKKAYEESLNSTKTGEQLTILPTYSAMLDIRKYVSGKSIL